MVDVEEARQQVASARALVAEKKAQAEQAQAQLNQQEQSLPSTTSQMDLRKRFSGMQGRIQRQVIDKERADIQEAQGYVKSYKDELGRYESDINATESQINEYERRVEEARRDAREEAKAELDAYKAEFEAANPGEKLIVDWSRLRIKGVESGALMQSLPVEQYNSKIEEINKKINSVGSTIPQINKELPRGEKIPEVRKDIMGFDLIPMASAQQVSTSNISKKEWKPNIHQPLASASYFVEKGVKTISPTIHEKVFVRGDTALRNIPAVNVSANVGIPIAEGLVSGAMVSPALSGNTGITKNVGRIKSIRTQEELIETLPVKFLGKIDESSGKYVARMDYQGNVYTTLTKVKNAPVNVPSSKGAVGREISVLKYKGGDVTIGLNDVAVINKPLGKANQVRTLNNGLVKSIKQEVPEVTTFLSTGYRSVRRTAPIKLGKAGLIDTIGESAAGRVRANMGKINTPKPNLQSSNTLGIVKPVRGKEGFFDIIASPKPKLRIYKKGGISYTAEPESFNIMGRVKVGSSTEQASGALYFKQVMQNVPVSEVARGVKEIAKSKAAASDFARVTGLRIEKSVGTKQTVPGVSKQTAVQKSVQKQDIFSGFSQVTGVKQTGRTIQKVNQRSKQKTQQPQENIMFGFNEMSGIKQTSRQSYKIGQKQRTQQKTKTDMFSSFDSSFTPRTQPFFPPSISYKTTGGKVIKQSPGRYLVVVKRYGTDSVIGEAATLEEAKRMLSSNLRSTLGASGFVTQKGSSRKEDVSDLFGGMFTSAKKDRFRLVQKRGKRLSSRSEVNEIFGFNRRKGGKSKPLKINWFS